MVERMLENMRRQKAALDLLVELLHEEAATLRAGDPHGVSRVEMSIQELIRQVSVERADLKALAQARVPGNQRLDALLAELADHEARPLREMLVEIDRCEQRCAMLSAMNAELAMALHDQSRGLMDYLKDIITPQRTDTYTARGSFPKGFREAALMRGRL